MTAEGVGTATTLDNENAPLVITQTTELAGLFPGKRVNGVKGTIHNPNNVPLKVNQIHARIEVDGAHLAAGCTSDNYGMTQIRFPDVVQSNTFMPSRTIAAGETVRWAAGASSETTDMGFWMSNEDTNQDACKGAKLTVTYSVS